jgi:hypothetical protein
MARVLIAGLFNGAEEVGSCEFEKLIGSIELNFSKDTIAIYDALEILSTALNKSLDNANRQVMKLHKDKSYDGST